MAKVFSLVFLEENNLYVKRWSILNFSLNVFLISLDWTFYSNVVVLLSEDGQCTAHIRAYDSPWSMDLKHKHYNKDKIDFMLIIPVRDVGDSKDMRRNLVSLLSLINFYDLFSINRQSLVWINNNAEEPRVCLEAKKT